LKKRYPHFKPPHLVVWSSASLDDKFWTMTPAFVHHLFYAAMCNAYNDLKAAEAYLRTQDDWLVCTFVMPGGISHDIQRGNQLSTSEQQTFVSFLDVAAAMVEVADGGERWDGQNVSFVLKRGQRAKVEWWAPVVLGKGFLMGVWPCMYK
jgi:hypothetical protein